MNALLTSRPESVPEIASNNGMNSAESAREKLGAWGRLRVENGPGENRDVRGAGAMDDQRAIES